MSHAMTTDAGLPLPMIGMPIMPMLMMIMVDDVGDDDDIAIRGPTLHHLPLNQRVRLHPVGVAESGRVWVGAASRPAGLRTGRVPSWSLGPAPDAALPVQQKTRRREGGRRPP
jgi:hypothetical protein